jgi:carboxymethylenebutenolidase
MDLVYRHGGSTSFERASRLAERWRELHVVAQTVAIAPEWYPIGGRGVPGDGPGPAFALTITGPDGCRSGGLPAATRGATMAYEGMIAETIAINGDKNEPISAYVARPLGRGPFPGVVLIHHAPGWDEWYREATRKFAHHGYAAISHNLYHRAGEGKADDVAAKVRAEGGVADAQVIGDTEGAVAWLRAQPYLNGKVGVMGTCSGGRQTFLFACHTKNIDAAIDLWGGRVVMSKEELTPKQPTAPIEFTKNLSCPLLGLFGNEDRAPTPEQVDQHEAELKKHGKQYEFHRYDGAGHGFFYYDRPMYRIEQALDGWQKVFSFFQKHLAA